jgi:uncharacterized membrane protein
VNLFGSLVSPVWLWAGNLALAALLYGAVRTQPWRWLAAGSRLHAYAGATVACMLLWSISAKLGSGPGFHLLGTTVLTLLFGPRLALLSTVLVLIGVSAAGLAGWEAFGLNALLMGAVPIATSYAVYRWSDRRLPNHFFVYVLVTSFLNGGLAMTASRCAAHGLLWLAGNAGAGVAANDYVLASVLLAWGEALISGMMMTLCVVYRPDWVMLFDDAKYIVGR